MIQRTAFSLIQQRAAQRPVVLVSGARQVGKTHLVRAAFPDHDYVTLDLPSDAALADQDPEQFFARHPGPVIIDEVQYAPGLFRHLKALVDRDRSTYGRYILTGSQALPLMQGVSDSLAGRIDLVELEGLSFAEIRAAFPDITAEEVMIRGGFPELWADRSLDAEAWFRSYVATYLQRDVRQVQNVSSLRDFERFVRACALRSAQLLNRNELARDVGISAPTAANWLSVLNATQHVALLEPWFSNATKSLVRSPKLYVRDAGLCAFLLGLHSVAALPAAPLAGPLFETLVFSELRRQQSAQRGGWSLWFWRDRSSEADFLAHEGGRFDLADAKWTTQPAERDLRSLRSVEAALGRQVVRSLSIVCRAPQSYPLGPSAAALPLGEPWPRRSAGQAAPGV